MDEQIESQPFCCLVAERDHVSKFPGRIDVQKREWRFRWKERLQRKVQHHRTILADRIEHHGPFTLGNHFAQNVEALGLETLKMRQSPDRRCSCRNEAA